MDSMVAIFTVAGIISIIFSVIFSVALVFERRANTTELELKAPTTRTKRQVVRCIGFIAVSVPVAFFALVWAWGS